MDRTNIFPFLDNDLLKFLEVEAHTFGSKHIELCISLGFVVNAPFEAVYDKLLDVGRTQEANRYKTLHHVDFGGYEATADNGDDYYIYREFGSPFNLQLNGYNIHHGWLYNCVEFANRLAAYAHYLQDGTAKDGTWQGREMEAKGMCRVWVLKGIWN